jgi:hypothetical protein
MACYIISYDLNTPGQDYIELTNAIERVGTTAWQCLNAAWLVITDLTAVQIRDALKPYVDKNDELLIAQLGNDAAWRGGGRHFSEGLMSVFDALKA